MKNKLVNKFALITGAARRVGEAIARTLHDNNYTIIIHYNMSKETAKKLAYELNSKRQDSAYIFKANLENSKEVLSMVEYIQNNIGSLNVVINNASVFYKHDINNYDEILWQKIFKVNVFTPLILSQKLFPLLKENNGSIINITDINAVNPIKNYNIYLQSKASLALQTKALALEFAPFVRVNAVAPGAIMWPEKDNTLSEEIKQKIIQDTPLLTHGEPNNIAQACLAFINNNFITGQILNVDGGRSIV